MAVIPTKSIGPFVGLNNRVPDHQLAIVERGRKAGDYLRNAVNVDLTASGTLQRRPGTEQVLPMSGAHSLWSDEHAAFFVADGTLYQLSDTLQATALRTGLVPGRSVSYARVSGDVYWSNGLLIERITAGVSGPAGVPPLNPAPVVSAASGGSLPAGLYQVALTRRSASGEESGSTTPVQVSVPENGTISVTGIAGGTDFVSVYMSPPNGDMLFRAAVLPAGQSVVSFPAMPALAGRLQTLLMRPMPAGQIVRYAHGRLLVASGSMLYFSEPFAPALHNPSKGYIPFPERITVVEPTDGGVYVVADETYWLAGPDITQSEVVTKLPYGAVEGTSGQNPRDKTVFWFSSQGLVVGTPDGQVKNLQEDAVSVDPASSGATLYREQNGMRQLVSSLFGSGTSVAAASSFMSAEIVRKESML